MSTIVTIAGSRFPAAGSAALLSHVTRRLVRAGAAVVPVEIGDLPAAALAVGDTTDPGVAAAVATVLGADALVVAAPAHRAWSPGPLENFLGVLPRSALRGRSVLPLVTGDSDAAAATRDGALRPVLAGLGAVVGRPWWLLSSQIETFADGGVLIDPAAAGPLAEATESFLAAVAGDAPAPSPLQPPSHRVSPVAGAPDLTVRHVRVGDPALTPLLDALVVEYGTRYGRSSAQTELTEVPASDFVPPDGAFLVLTENGDSVAGGALRRYDELTAEVKRVWTSARHRRRGLAHRVMAELEHTARTLGYQRMHLTTGPRQPEARALYLSTGYRPRFDVTADPETIGPLAFGKELVPGAGFADWVQPTWAQVQARHVETAGAPR